MAIWECRRTNIVFFLLVAVLCFRAWNHHRPTRISSDQLFIPWKSSCYITCRGTDGLGHQLEAKLSCLATAFALNYTYVHQPLDAIEHGLVDGKDVLNDKVFAWDVLQDQYPATIENYDSRRMIRVPRQKHNYSCDTNNAESDKIRVLERDNCWDFFWANLTQIPIQAFLSSLMTALRQKWLQEWPVSDFVKAAGAQRAFTIAVHLRLGDARTRSSSGALVRTILDHLCTAIHNKYDNATIMIVVHTDGTVSQAIDKLRLSSDKSLNQETWDMVDIRAKLVIRARDSIVKVSILEVLSDFLRANVLVAATSSLSNAVGLVRSRPVLHPIDPKRATMVHLPHWSMMQIEAPSNLSHCIQIPGTLSLKRACLDWQPVNSLFWDTLLKNYVMLG